MIRNKLARLILNASILSITVSAFADTSQTGEINIVFPKNGQQIGEWPFMNKYTL